MKRKHKRIQHKRTQPRRAYTYEVQVQYAGELDAGIDGAVHLIAECHGIMGGRPDASVADGVTRDMQYNLQGFRDTARQLVAELNGMEIMDRTIHAKVVKHIDT